MSKENCGCAKLSAILLISSIIAAFTMVIIDVRLIDEESFVSGEHAKNVMLLALFFNLVFASVVAWWMERKGV